MHAPSLARPSSLTLTGNLIRGEICFASDLPKKCRQRGLACGAFFVVEQLGLHKRQNKECVSIVRKGTVCVCVWSGNSGETRLVVAQLPVLWGLRYKVTTLYRALLHLATLSRLFSRFFLRASYSQAFKPGCLLLLKALLNWFGGEQRNGPSLGEKEGDQH